MSSERKLTSARADGAKAAGRKTGEGIARTAANAKFENCKTTLIPKSDTCPSDN
jgi:hypothetical protein